MATIVTINASDQITNSRTDINSNFANLNSDKIETSAIDTDTALAANSDAKIPSQKAVKAYIDSGGNPDASETARGIVEEATDAEVTAGTATGATGAKLFVTPAKLATRLGAISNEKISTTITAGEDINGTTTPVPVMLPAGNSVLSTIVSQTGTGTNLDATGSGGTEDWGYLSKMSTSAGSPFNAVLFRLKKSGSPTGNMTAYVLADNGGEPGSIIATLGTLDVSTLGTGYGNYTFISNTIFTSQTDMWVAWEAPSTVNGSNFISGEYSSASGQGVRRDASSTIGSFSGVIVDSTATPYATSCDCCGARV
jgi:hypothetical protein